MLAIYGRLKRFLDKAYDRAELSPITGDDLVDVIQSERLEENNITAVALFGTDYAAIGSKPMRLREVLNEIKGTIPIIIVAETESLLRSKKPSNPNLIILIEKSKKPDILKNLIDNYINDVADDFEVEQNQNTDFELQKDYDEPLFKAIITEIPGNNEEDYSSNILIPQTRNEIQSVLPEIEETEIEETENLNELLVEDVPHCISEAVSQEKNILLEKNFECTQYKDEPFLDFQLVELPYYAPLSFNTPDDVIDHLRRKWNMDGDFH